MRAAIYARASDSENLRIQREALHRYAEVKNWDTVFELCVIDSSIERPGRDEVLERALGGDIDVVLVFKLDRWGQSVADLVESLEKLADNGISFVSISESFDFNAGSKAILDMVPQVLSDFNLDVRASREERRKRRDSDEMESGTQMAQKYKEDVRRLSEKGLSPETIAQKLGLSRVTIKQMLKRLNE
jgi:Site-specific recombinases, DNA invertase Pin homologs